MMRYCVKCAMLCPYSSTKERSLVQRSFCITMWKSKEEGSAKGSEDNFREWPTHHRRIHQQMQEEHGPPV